MNPLQQLDSYLRKLESNLRQFSIARGAAILCSAALLVTIGLVLIANQFSFSQPSVFWSRVLLFFVVAAALCAGLIVPLMRLNRKRAANRAETRFPEFKQRLLTYTEKANTNSADPFLPLLAADALSVAEQRASEPLVPRSFIVSFGSVAAIAITVLLWLGISGPGFLGYGTALLWGGVPRADRKPIYSIRVEPGTHRIRRRADQPVTAILNGFTSSKVSVFAKYASSPKWEEAPMVAKPQSSSYEFLFAGVPEDVEYYVEAGGVKSNSYRFTVVDLPAVKNIKVTYHYPSFLGLKQEVEDPGGDLRAVEGTEAEVEISTDKPLAQASLMLDSGTKINLTTTPNGHLTARVPIQKDDMYHVATPDGGEMVRLTENYFIEARRDDPPTVSISHPGKDAKVSPVEEVTVNVQGKDDFGLQALELHYSVNGGDEKTISMLNGKGRKEADGSTTLSLEDYKLVPGDVVSMYAVAKDARTTSRSDIYFVEAQPFEKEYSQAQAGGGGGGGGGEEEQKISDRQKEVIAATWNQVKAKEKKSDAENAKYLSEVQGKLRDQAKSLATRMKARQLSENNPAFKSFTEDMEKAVDAMGPASDQLRGQQFKSALTPEQKALQYLLRAEATFRQIQVAFGKQGGGGGGGGGASRDLENLFDLELDTEKNQYESGQQSAAEKQQKAVDDALAKLKELARRQQELAQQQGNKQQTAQQRWQQEMLRREAEELRKQMEQISRGEQQQQGEQQGQQQQGQQQGQQQQGQQSGQQQGKQGQQGQQSGQQQSRSQSQMSGSQQRQMEQAINRLKEATRDMSSSASAQSRAQQQGQQQQGQQGQQQQQSDQAKGQADARKAAERLQEAQDMLGAMRQQQSGDQMQNLARDSERLAKQQEAFADKLRKNFGAGQGEESAKQQQSAGQMAQEKEAMMNDLKRLEQQMQSAARDMAQTQSDASSKVREALGRIQQNEVQARMKATADMLKRGMGAYAVMREAPVTKALSEMAEDLRKAQGAVGKGKDGKPGQGNADQAVQQAEKLRQQIEQMAQSLQQQGKGQQPGKGQPGEQGQSGEQGQQGGQQQGGQQGGQQRGENAGGQRGGGGPTIGDSYNEAMRDFNRLQQASRDNPEISKQLQAVGNDLRGLNPRQNQNNPELLNRLIGQVLGDAQQLELTLRRKTDAATAPHAGTPQQVPPGYNNAVAEYYRRLSK